MQMYYKIYGGEEDGKEVTIDMNPCSDLDFYQPSSHESLNRVAEAHMQAE